MHDYKSTLKAEFRLAKFPERYYYTSIDIPYKVLLLFGGTFIISTFRGTVKDFCERMGQTDTACPVMPHRTGRAHLTLPHRYCQAAPLSNSRFACRDPKVTQARLRRADLPAGHQRGCRCGMPTTDATRRRMPHQRQRRDGSRQGSGTGTQP